MIETDCGRIVMYTIFNSPDDHPGKFVVVRDGIEAGRVTRDDRYKVLASTLELARDHIPRGLACLSRNRNDVPSVVEVWF